MFIVTLLTVAKIWEYLRVPLLEEWIKKEREISYAGLSGDFHNKKVL